MAVMGLTFVLGFSWLNVQAATTDDTDSDSLSPITLVEYVYVNEKMYSIARHDVSVSTLEDESKLSSDVDDVKNPENDTNLTDLTFHEVLSVETTNSHGINGRLEIPDSDTNYSLSHIFSSYILDKMKSDSIGMEGFANGTGQVDVYLYYLTSNDDATWTPEAVSEVTLKTNKGDKTVTVRGDTNSTVSVDVPEVSGYTPDKSTVKVDIANDGSMTVEDNSDDNPITYTKDDTSSSSTGTDTSGNSVTQSGSSDSNIVDKSQLVSINVDKGDVTLYKLEDNAFSKVTNRALSPASDWKSNAYVEIDGETYYRVANNEWVKADTVYVYEPDSITVDTKNQETSIRNSEDKQITNRALAKNTAWKVDRIAYLGSNDTPYYRVATNMFVSVNDVTKE
ncbi:hypothetical protein FHL05_05880 [Lactobacillus halodurans]|uniref:S-layer protein C-terminal domain-containing protein n=2 Tax=Companilactobacillus halodurans TaxID=2584183 RepID=A0A5P0ZWS9_9LACO|nr:hypothetical protein [Companilactobacillus halodurans]